MKKLIISILIVLSTFFSGCISNNYQTPQFTVYDLEMERNIDYILDKTHNVIYLPKIDPENEYTLKITPPQDLKDLSEVKIWCNEILFTNGDMFYSNGRDIYVTLPKGKRVITKISVQWTFNSRVQEYFITYK